MRQETDEHSYLRRAHGNMAFGWEVLARFLRAPELQNYLFESAVRHGIGVGHSCEESKPDWEFYIGTSNRPTTFSPEVRREFSIQAERLEQVARRENRPFRANFWLLPSARDFNRFHMPYVIDPETGDCRWSPAVHMHIFCASPKRGKYQVDIEALGELDYIADILEERGGEREGQLYCDARAAYENWSDGVIAPLAETVLSR